MTQKKASESTLIIFFQIYHLILDFSLKINTIYIKYLIYISSFNSDIAVFKIDTIYFCF